MLVAVLSDIHANVEALEAALDDARRRGAVAVLVAGDLVGDGPDPAEVVDLLRQSSFPVIRGNVDDKVVETARLSEAEQAALSEKRRKADLVRTVRALGPTDLEWIRELPATLTLRFAGKRLLLVHGSPLGITDYIFPSLTPEALTAKLGADRPDVLACGHSHIPFARRIRGVLVVNAGSVGRPIDGDPRGSYGLVEMIKSRPPRGRIVRFHIGPTRPRARVGSRRG
jgi:putative phosphoesterase